MITVAVVINGSVDQNTCNGVDVVALPVQACSSSRSGQGHQAATPAKVDPNPAAEKGTSLCSRISLYQDFVSRFLRSQKREPKAMDKSQGTYLW